MRLRCRRLVEVYPNSVARLLAPGPPTETFTVQDTPAHEGPHRRLGVMSAAHEADTRHYIVMVSYIAKSFSRSLPTRPMQVVEDAG